jgi:hypothetical protein
MNSFKFKEKRIFDWEDSHKVIEHFENLGKEFLSRICQEGTDTPLRRKRDRDLRGLSS